MSGGVELSGAGLTVDAVTGDGSYGMPSSWYRGGEGAPLLSGWWLEGPGKIRVHI